ncbi:MAG: hypothetical protein WCI57_02795 [Candidatus Berkelbacteria bacterium]
MTQAQSKTRMVETGTAIMKEDPDNLPMNLIRANSTVGSMFDLMTQTLYSARTFANEPETIHAVRCACRLTKLGFDDTTVSAMLCHKIIRHTLKPHLVVLLELEMSADYETAKIIERCSFIPQTETPQDYLDKLREYIKLDWRILPIIGADWEDELLIMRSGRNYRYSSEIKLMTEILPSIEQSWEYWRTFVPAHQKHQLDAVWSNVFFLAQEEEII